MKAPTRELILAAAIAAPLAAASSAPGQSRQIPAPPQSRPVLLSGAAVHTMNGADDEIGWVLFDQGRITGVGAGAPPRSASAGAEVLDAAGLHVYPGLISMHTTLGLTEIGAVPVTDDTTELGELTPEVRAAVAVNPDSDLIPVTRANGILTALVAPRGGIVSGRASIIRMDGWTWEQMAIDAQAGLAVNWPSSSARRGFRRGGGAPPAGGGTESGADRATQTIRRIDRLFDDAAAYVAARAADPTQEADLRLEAMRPIIAGEKPVFVRASSRDQIESAVAWAARRGVKIVIVGGADADLVVPLLAQYDIPVIVTGLHRLPDRRDDPYDRPCKLPLALYEGGVRFAIASGEGSAHERNLNHNVGSAVACGLPHRVALESVTSEAARILGLGESLGSIEPGKSATLIVTTGDPLQITTDTLIAFVDGRRVDLGSRHKALYEKYREKYRQLGLVE